MTVDFGILIYIYSGYQIVIVYQYMMCMYRPALGVAGRRTNLNVWDAILWISKLGYIVFFCKMVFHCACLSKISSSFLVRNQNFTTSFQGLETRHQYTMILYSSKWIDTIFYCLFN